MNSRIAAPTVLWAFRPGALLRAARLSLGWTGSRAGKALLLGIWVLVCAWSAHRAAWGERDLTWSPWLLLALSPLVLVRALLHEVGHAAAIVASGAPAPRIGVAYRKQIGVYCFTELSGLPRCERGPMRRVLSAGYEVDALVSILVGAAAAAAPVASPLRGTLLLAHALSVTSLLVGMWPSNRFTDLGQIVRMLRALPPRRPREAALLVSGWKVSTALCLGWLAVLVVRLASSSFGVGGGQ